MKMEHRWLAWMAALMLASVLLATPREGATGTRPHIFIDQQPGAPLFGDPDVPSDGPIQFRHDGLWVRMGGLQIRVRTSPTLGVLVIGSVRQPAPIRARKSLR